MLFVENLTVKAKNTVILQNISFLLEDHSSLAVIGPSGSGKTTLANALVGFTENKECMGTVRHNKLLLQRNNEKLVSLNNRTIGYIAQELSLWPHLTVKKTLDLATAFAKTGLKLDTLIDLLDLAPLLHKKPHQLSGGEKQRLSLARALAKNPTLLVLDEPFCAIDSVRRNQLINIIMNLQKELMFSIILITHDLLEAHRIAEKIMVLKNGAIRFFGPKEKLSSNHFDEAWNPYPLIFEGFK